MFEKVQRVPRGGEKRQNIFKSGFEIYFSFYVENGLFSALCHLSRPENGAKVQNRVGFGAFWAQNRKKGQKHRMNIICESEKKCGTEFEKANWASKMRVAFRLLYVIAASLPVLKPAEFAVFCDRGFGFRNGMENGCCKKRWHLECFAYRSLCECVDSGLFFERIGTFQLPYCSNWLRTSAIRKITGKALKMFDKESVSFLWK